MDTYVYHSGSKGNFYYVNNSYIAHEAMENDPAVWETLYNLHGVRDIPRGGLRKFIRFIKLVR